MCSLACVNALNAQRTINIGGQEYRVADINDITFTHTNTTIGDILSNREDYSIFNEAIEKTGFADKICQTNKGINYTYASTKPTDGYGNILYCPTTCRVGYTMFVEPNAVFNQNGIYSFDDLVKKCREWYGGAAGWYNYLNEKGIAVSTGTDYTNPFNVVNMFVAYHVVKGNMAVDELVYERNQKTEYSWNYCFGYEQQEYYETLLPHTLLKVWQLNPKTTKDLYINRYRLNNTLTDEYGTFGSDAKHPIIWQGAKVNRNASIKACNGNIHSINEILVYNENAVKSQNERMRFDVTNILHEMSSNGLRSLSTTEVSKLNNNGEGSRIALDNTYFDNLYCYNPNTMLRFCVKGPWRSLNADEFQGWGAYDYAIKLPPVPSGTYEIRINYYPSSTRGQMEFFLGENGKESSFAPLGKPLDAWADPEGNIMGCEQILTKEEDENTDYGIKSDKIMKANGFMRAPASFSRGTYNIITDKLTYDPSDIYSAAKEITGGINCRSEWGYGIMALRYIISTEKLEQGKEYWLRIIGHNTNPNISENDSSWLLDVIELCPTTISNNTDMHEDWY